MYESEILERTERLSGVGLGWRPELAWFIQEHPRLGFTEVIAENADRHLDCLRALADRGTPVVIHGVTLGLGDPEPLAQERIDRLARAVDHCGADCGWDLLGRSRRS